MDLFSDLKTVALSQDGDYFLIQAPYSAEANEKLRQHIPGVKRDKSRGFWTVPVTSSHAELLAKKLSNFEWSNEALMKGSLVTVEEQQRRTLSRADTAELTIPGFLLDPYGYQKAGILYATERKKVIIGDEMGLGKTPQCLGVFEYNDAYPALVVTPSSLKYNWADDEIPKFLGKKRRVVVADKSTSPLVLKMADIIITNYEQLVGYRSVDVWSDKQNKMIKSRSAFTDQTKKEVILSPLAQNLIEHTRLVAGGWDEAHKLKDGATANTLASREVRKGLEFILLLSGTPMLNYPSEFASLLQFIYQLDHFGGWWHFMVHYCGMQKNRFNRMEAKEAYDTTELNDKLRSLCYIRRNKVQVWKDMPALIRGHVSVIIDNPEEYVKAQNELFDWVRDRVRADEEFLASIAHLPHHAQELEIYRRQEEKAEAAERGEAMVKIQALKDVTARGKMPATKEWIDNFHETDPKEKIVVFATHKKIINQLLKWYPKCARIISEDDARERHANVKRFQREPDCWLLVGAQGTSATNTPAGTGHQLSVASNTLTLELGWNNALHDQCESRCHRIPQDRTVTSHYTLGRYEWEGERLDTIEYDIAETIEHKRTISSEVTDGIKRPEEDAGILDELFNRWKRRL